MFNSTPPSPPRSWVFWKDVRVNRALSAHEDRGRMLPFDQLKVSHGAFVGHLYTKDVAFFVQKMGLPGAEVTNNPDILPLALACLSIMDLIYTNETNFQNITV